MNVRHDAATGKDVCTVDVVGNTPVRRVVKDRTGAVPDDEVLFCGPRLVLSLADQGDPSASELCVATLVDSDPGTRARL